MIPGREQSVAWTTFASDGALASAAAAAIAERIGRSGGHNFVLGCPAGRSPRSTLKALARLVRLDRLDLRRLHIVMMDEFVERRAGRWRLCDADSHFSCRRFGLLEIVGPLNAAAAPERRMPRRNLHWPSAARPSAYEPLIERLGGIDLFLLASGASDGHVAFNAPGTALGSTTRVVRLAETTRQDNLATFPAFRDIDAVPQFGVSVGLGTIARWSRSAILLLSGPAKRRSAARLRSLKDFDPAWPASIIFACRDPHIFADRNAMRPQR